MRGKQVVGKWDAAGLHAQALDYYGRMSRITRILAAAALACTACVHAQGTPKAPAPEPGPPARSALTADTSAAVVGFQLHFNTLAKATLMGLFKRD